MGRFRESEFDALWYAYHHKSSPGLWDSEISCIDNVRLDIVSEQRQLRPKFVEQATFIHSNEIGDVFKDKGGWPNFTNEGSKSENQIPTLIAKAVLFASDAERLTGGAASY
jgi:hypothetical protein